MLEKLKENNKLLIPIIIVGIIVIFGITYAWLSQVISGTKVNKITVGALSLVMDDETSNGINIENGLPQTDAQGLNNDAYTFSVNNSGAGSAVYKLYLEDEEIETERILDSNIKFNITRNGDTVKEGLLTTSVVEGRRELDSILIKEGETNNYSLRLWIDSEATQSEVANKVFKAKIKLEGTQAQEASTLSLSEDSEIEEGETHTFNVTVTPSLSDTANLKWCSNSNSIISGATVQGRCNEGEYEITSCYGKTTCEVEGTNGGEATITVRTRNISDSARLIVNKAVMWLYNEGNEYTNITGGWGTSDYIITDYSSRGGSNYGITLDSSNMIINKPNVDWGWTQGGTNNYIDISEYKSAHFIVSEVISSTRDLSFRILDSKTTSTYTTTYSTTTTGEHIVDISSISGNKYISFCVIDGGGYKISKVWLEK